MGSAVFAAIIGGIFAIIAALIPHLLKRYKRLKRRLNLDLVKGSIENPSPNQETERKISCSGLATNLKRDMNLWVIVEVENLMWPKSKVIADKDGKWSTTIFEDGTPDEFSIELFVMNSAGDKRIRRWLEYVSRTGNYPGLPGIPGARRIARIDGLRLAKEK